LENISLIIKGCIAKNPSCQKMVYENYRGFALKTVFRYIYRYEKAVDTVNDGFVRLFNHFDRFKEAQTEEANRKLLMAYIKQIMVHGAIDELRKGSLLPEIGGYPDYVLDSSSKEQEADQQLLYKQLIVFIKELPPIYRIVFNMYVIDGFNHLEIANLLNIPVGTSKSNLSRAKAMLQANIKKSESKNLCRI